jgi:glycosyltransferase involved in cell wall biosynthesis
MRVVFLIHSLSIGGAERQLTVLSKGLRDRGHEVVVIVFYSGGPLEQDLRSAGVRIRSLNKRSRWDIRALLGRLPHIIREERPDVLYAFDGTPNLASLIPKTMFPELKVVWGIRCSGMELDRYEWIVKPLSALTRWSANMADVLVANSNAGLTYYAANGYPRQKMVMIPNGVDVERFRSDRRLGLSVRGEWGVNDREVLIGIVARLDPMKDHVTFLRAAARLAAQREHVRFVCVGEGPRGIRESLERLVETLGIAPRIIWAGARKDMPAVYNALDICVSSSAYGEGVSNAISEAMACGVPCVVTDVGDSPWIVGPLGPIVPPRSPELLADSIAQVCDHLNVSTDAIRRQICEQLSIENLVARTEHVLTALLHNTPVNVTAAGSVTVP